MANRSKIYNQKKIETSLNRCEALAGNMIERNQEIKFRRVLTLKENYNAVNDYIFGLSTENPLKDYTDQINENISEYTDICDGIVQEVLKSRR